MPEVGRVPEAQKKRDTKQLNNDVKLEQNKLQKQINKFSTRKFQV